MRFIWFPAAPHGPVVIPGMLLSVATHAALLGAVTYGRGPHSDLLHFSEPREPEIYYLPPPDREPGQRAMEERLTWVELTPGGSSAAPESRNGSEGRRPAQDHPRRNGGATGDAVASQAAAVAVNSDDSVYSVLATDESAVRVEGSAAPVYPPDMLAHGIEGSVMTRYVIDTTGRADSTSLEVLAASNPAFEQAVRAAVPGMRFLSAQVQGRKVRQLVQQEFQFRITAPAVVPPAVPAEHTRTRPTE
ncbi:MAG TPA: energy transducer TonB [Gemmatimonadaceae bacterium]|nr:energy transducer TonB [Gemmatimonadaceae bacterium]